MRPLTNFISSIHLLFIFLLFALSVFFVFIPYVPHFKRVIVHLLLDKPHIFVSVGLILMGIVSLLFFGFYSMYRYRYVRVLMKESPCDVDLAVLLQYVQKNLEGLYPDQKMNVEIFPLKKDQIEIVLYTSSMHPKERRIFLQKIEIEFASLLKKYFGYEKEFIVTLLFRQN